MITHLLVPLDGSALAESVLPAVSYLASAFHTRVTLVHVIEQNPPSEVHGQPHLRTPGDAQEYLEGIAERALPEGIAVEYHVHTSAVQDVARSIVDHVEEFATDLIVMCTHGHGGPREWLFGSIAQQVIGLGSTPVLLIQPNGGEKPREFRCGNMLIPLDGNPAHEGSLPVVAEFARSCHSKVHLLMVVPTFGTVSGQLTVISRLMPGSTSKMLDMAVKSAGEYLQAHESDLRDSGIDVSYEVLRGDPASLIESTASELDVDVIIFGTHGKAGTDAFWSGSVTSKVCKNCHIPLLLIPVHDGKK